MLYLHRLITTSLQGDTQSLWLFWKKGRHQETLSASLSLPQISTSRLLHLLTVTEQRNLRAELRVEQGLDSEYLRNSGLPASAAFSHWFLGCSSHFGLGLHLSVQKGIHEILKQVSCNRNPCLLALNGLRRQPPVALAKEWTLTSSSTGAAPLSPNGKDWLWR